MNPSPVRAVHLQALDRNWTPLQPHCHIPLVLTKPGSPLLPACLAAALLLAPAHETVDVGGVNIWESQILTRMCLPVILLLHDCVTSFAALKFRMRREILP